jgi:hypothetical protein
MTVEALMTNLGAEQQREMMMPIRNIARQNPRDLRCIKDVSGFKDGRLEQGRATNGVHRIRFVIDSVNIGEYEAGFRIKCNADLGNSRRCRAHIRSGAMSPAQCGAKFPHIENPKVNVPIFWMKANVRCMASQDCCNLRFDINLDDSFVKTKLFIGDVSGEGVMLKYMQLNRSEKLAALATMATDRVIESSLHVNARNGQNIVYLTAVMN